MLTKARVKYIQSLAQKKLRDEAGEFVAEGPKVVPELLSAGMECIAVYALASWMSENSALLHKAASVEEVDDVTLSRLSHLSTPNTVVAVFKKRTHAGHYDYAGKISLVLDDIQDPGNLGTIIRIADWFAVEHIVCSPSTADCYNPKVVQSTMGSLARVHILYTDLSSFLEQHHFIPAYAAMASGTPLQQVGNLKQGFILIGNESKGVSQGIVERCKGTISIPRLGKAESLNAAIAAGIILSHIR
jgi:RNA methyltransferase, TrmH family